MAALHLRCGTWAFSSCCQWGLFSSCGVWDSLCGCFSCCRAQALGCVGFSRCSAQAQQLWCTGLIVQSHVGSSWARIKLVSPALAGRFPTTDHQGSLEISCLDTLLSFQEVPSCLFQSVFNFSPELGNPCSYFLYHRSKC